MKIGAIIQSRMSSERLPGKALRPIAGMPMLQYLLEALQQCTQLDAIVVCTSTNVSDGPIAEFCRRLGVDCFRGPLANVAERYKRALEHYQFDGFVRVNGDSPFFDHRLIDRAVATLREGRFEVVTNALEPNRPKGQGVEVLRTDTFLRTFTSLRSADDQEHVTQHIYDHHDQFRFHRFTMPADDRDVRLNVDTEEDLAMIQAMLAKMDKPHWRYPLNELVDLYRQVAPVTAAC
jgi:spore coat polysaccharide biosynthesis protein SpsF